MFELPRCLIFDWDECLVTQADLIAQVTEATLKKHLSLEEYYLHKDQEVISGQSMKQVFPRIFGEDRWHYVRDSFYELFAQTHLEQLQFMPGALDLLNAIHQLKIPMFIVSNKKGHLLRIEVQHLNVDHLFTAIIGSEDALEDKPSRLPVDLALHKTPFSLTAPNLYGPSIWFIGDRLTDIQTAHACGCTAVYVGSCQEVVLQDTHCDYSVINLKELQILLASSKLLESWGWVKAQKISVFGDMSPRQYTRYQLNEQTLMIMDAHRQPESIQPFIKIQKHLKHLGYSVPTIYEHDQANNLLLIEDFGDNAFQDILKNQPEKEQKLYQLAIDLLIDLHSRQVNETAPSYIEHYDQNIYLDKLDAYLKVYWPKAKNCILSDVQSDSFLSIWQKLLTTAHQVPQTLVLRDYNRRNIFFLKDRTGLSQCGLIDFQDAVRGPITEDLLSLLTSSRIPMDETLRRSLIDRYLSAFENLNTQKFWASWNILTTHRVLRLLGLYSEAGITESGTDFTQYIPRLEQLLLKQLECDELWALREWFKF